MTLQVKTHVAVEHCDVVVELGLDNWIVTAFYGYGAPEYYAKTKSTKFSIAKSTSNMASGIATLPHKIGDISDSLLHLHVIREGDAHVVRRGLLKKIVQANQKLHNGGLKQWTAHPFRGKDAAANNRAALQPCRSNRRFSLTIGEISSGWCTHVSSYCDERILA